MSVEKMEKYKEYKKHRKEILRKQKRKARIQLISGITATVLVLGCVIFFIYQDVKPEYKFDSRTLIDWNQYVPDDILGNDEEAENTETDGTDATPTEGAEDTTEGNADTNVESSDK